MATDANSTMPGEGPPWRPLSAIDRRVAGVLVEKAKTTPDAYPMSLNALTAGCNQKSNRAPVMQLAPEDVEESLDRLRGLGVVAEVHGDGRIARYKHRLYEWLGVEKVEMAVMTELLLRGTQTLGDLRGRAARMEPIADLAALKPVLDSLVAKGLVIYLTPQQRGAMVTHALYGAEELERLRREHGAEGVVQSPAAAGGYGVQPEAATADTPLQVPATRVAEAGSSPAGTTRDSELAGIQSQLRDLGGEIGELRSVLEAATAALRRDVDELRRQLGI